MRRMLITLLPVVFLLGAAMHTGPWEPPTLPPNPYESWTRAWVKENRVRIHCPRIGRLAERYARDLQTGKMTLIEASLELTRLAIYRAEDEADQEAFLAIPPLLTAAGDPRQRTPERTAQDAYTACARAYRAKRLFDDIR